MKLLVALLMICLPLSSRAEDPEAWRHQAYSQSKRLPDLHHAVDVKLADAMHPPAEFILKDGKLSCNTCHGIDDMADKPYDRVKKDDARFLRGGPYRALNQFCYNCHEKKPHERPNIHLLLNEQGEIRKDNCLYCHEELHEKRDKPLEQSRLKLRLPAEKLCFGCHLKTPHLNALEHQEAKPKEKMKKYMEKAAREQQIILPLSQEGRVTCVSCHTPHPEGVMNAGNPAGAQVSGDMKEGVKYQPHSWNEVFQQDKSQRLYDLWLNSGRSYTLNYQRLSNEVLLRLPALDGSLCLSCHEFER